MTDATALRIHDATNAPERRRPESVRAEARFRARVEELGGVVLDAEWKGVEHPHRVLCAKGHECAPWPSGVARGQGICRVCAGRDSRSAWSAFLQLVADNDGTVLESHWLGAVTPHRVRCVRGHVTAPRPHDARATGSICSVCVGRNKDAAWEAFRQTVSAIGGTVRETAWLGTHTHHKVVCPRGHDLRVRPSKVMARKRMPCGQCRNDDLAARYEEMVRAHGGTPLEPYRGAMAKHLVRCVNGHEASQTPSHLRAGHALCRRCARKGWDIFYVVMDDENGVVKFGLTSGNPTHRLRFHRADGFARVVRLLTALPGDTAPELERIVLSALADAREQPVRGREYFPARVLPVVLDLVDNHPVIRARSA